jgi:hypothetical protein
MDSGFAYGTTGLLSPTAPNAGLIVGCVSPILLLWVAAVGLVLKFRTAPPTDFAQEGNVNLDPAIAVPLTHAVDNGHDDAAFQRAVGGPAGAAYSPPHALLLVPPRLEADQVTHAPGSPIQLAHLRSPRRHTTVADDTLGPISPVGFANQSTVDRSMAAFGERPAVLALHDALALVSSPLKSSRGGGNLNLAAERQPVGSWSGRESGRPAELPAMRNPFDRLKQQHADERLRRDQAEAERQHWGVDYGQLPSPLPRAAESRGRSDPRTAPAYNLNFRDL